MRLSGQTLSMPSTVKTVLPETAKALEQAWQKRRQELAGWQPASGWLLEPRVFARRQQSR